MTVTILVLKAGYEKGVLISIAYKNDLAFAASWTGKLGLTPEEMEVYISWDCDCELYLLFAHRHVNGLCWSSCVFVLF